MRKRFCIVLSCLIVLFLGQQPLAQSQSVHTDKPFVQDYSIKYFSENPEVVLQKVYEDRNGFIKLLSSKGLMRLRGGEFLYPGTIVADSTYRSLNSKRIASLGLYQHQFVFGDDKAIFSNAWAGALFEKHNLTSAKLFSGGKDFSFLISDGKNIQYLKNAALVWEGSSTETLIDITYDNNLDRFYLLSSNSIQSWTPTGKTLSTVFSGSNFTAFALYKNGKELIVGTNDGYLKVDMATKKQVGETQRKLPATGITAVTTIDGKLWFGTNRGAFMLKDDGKFNYYASKRWLPSDEVTQIAAGSEGSVLVLTKAGLGKICFKKMTLADKAAFYDKQVRQRHIRNGFNATVEGIKEGDLSTGFMEDSDNDGLWTSMYLGGEAFRYAVTKSPEALQNCRESLDAMERLYSINPVKGFPARSFERRGYALHDRKAWRDAGNPEWEWKSTTSSDEAIGHIFVFGVLAELVDDAGIKKQAIRLMDSLMQHIIDNDMYLIDWDGKPTLWGKWHPDYVNSHPESVGDRKINSSNIIAMLQTAYHFTKKEVYKKKAFELMHKYGYLTNLMRPMNEIGKAPDHADDWSKMLSEGWNHSDDEMYFLGYWGLYRYAFNDTLKAKFKTAIIDHWQAERPEKEGAWNIFTAITGVKNFDLKEAIWYLQEYPLDMVSWTVNNSNRKDIELVQPNFRNQTTTEVLPPDELRISRHNANRFTLDGGSNGRDEYSAGDIWLLPYWMGRYLGVIR